MLSRVAYITGDKAATTGFLTLLTTPGS